MTADKEQNKNTGDHATIEQGTGRHSKKNKDRAFILLLALILTHFFSFQL